MIANNTLGSFSFDVIERILDILNQNGIWLKKTNLASKTGLNYNVCLRYLQMLNALGWVEVNSEVSITERGKGVCAKLLDMSEGRANIGSIDEHGRPSNLGGKNIEYFRSSYISPFMTDEKEQRVSHREQEEDGSNKKKNKTIMIVDDEKDVALTYEDFLSSAGYNVRTFIESRSALGEYVSHPFVYDLLVLDIRMRDINGIQLYQSVKAINPECRAIFVSCLDAASEVVSILPGVRPEDIMRKPVSREHFITAVKTALVQ